jgi:hypothetical protein
MGLHRDPSTYSSSSIEIHVRRLIWYQICFLDLRTCEATGPRPQIRPDDYDTRFPLNIDDVDIDRAEHGIIGTDLSKDKTHFTDMTITRMRFECYEMHRLLWIERPKVEQKRSDGERRVTLTTLLSRIQSFGAAMEKTYLPMLSSTVPLHVLAAEMYGILSNRLYIMVLQRYLSNDRSKMPERLRQIVLSAATMILEHSMTIEQQPALALWSWYLGALHQYHVALLLSNELYAGPREPAMEERVWKGLDFAFDLPGGFSNIEKMRMILEDLIGKTKIYAGMRKVRAPANMPRPGPRTHTPGWQLRQQEAREAEERSENLQSTTGSVSSAPYNDPTYSALQQQQSHFQQQQQRSVDQAPLNFPGAIPNVDWGNSSLPIGASNLQQPLPGLDTFNSDTIMSSGSLMPASLMTTASQRQVHDANEPRGASYGTTAGTTFGSNQMSALNDIDWVSTFLYSRTIFLTTYRTILSVCSVALKSALGIC